MVFWAYLLHCRGGSFYAGHTDDLEKRIAQHRAGSLRGYTSDKLLVEPVWSQEFLTRHEAMAAEQRIKGWSRAKKMALIRGNCEAVARDAKKKGGPSTSSGRTAEGAAEVWHKPSLPLALLARAAAAHPHECCGLLLGHGSTITGAQAAANVHPAPQTHFELDPAALIAAHRAARDGGPQILGYYHSHPHGPPAPSSTDAAMAAHDGRIWAIIGQGAVNWWRDTPSGFVALSPRLIAG